MKLRMPSLFKRDKSNEVEKSVTSPLTFQNVYGYVREIFTGSWQRNISRTADDVLKNNAVFSCISLISGDIGKLSLILLKKTASYTFTLASDKLPKVLIKPNKYQTWQKFVEAWIHSLLISGNAYILKIKDNGELVSMHVLTSTYCKPVITDEGDIYYEIQRTDLANEPTSRYITADEIIHDRINCFYHPLVGLPPIYACALAANQGLSIQENSEAFFNNMSRPSGILTSPTTIKQDTAERLKTSFESGYSQNNIGRIAVLGDGLEFKPLAISAMESQLIEQLRWTSETICSAFHVPMFKINIGGLPANADAEMLNQIYYSDCLQSLITGVEANLNVLDITNEGIIIKIDVRDLIRMDSFKKMESLGKGVKDGWLKPDEAREELYLGPVPGGDTPYMQQQNFSLAALAQRDSAAPAPNTIAPPTNAPAEPTQTPAPEKGLDFNELMLLLEMEVTVGEEQ